MGMMNRDFDNDGNITGIVPFVPEFDDGRTKQSFADSCDINKILKKAQKAGGLSHVLKYPEAVYGEFEGYDLLEAYGKLNRAQEIFNDLPSEVRREFEGDALRFAAYASNPENNKRLKELIPAIAEPGNFFPSVHRRSAESADAAEKEAEAAKAAAAKKAGEKPADGASSTEGAGDASSST